MKCHPSTSHASTKLHQETGKEALDLPAVVFMGHKLHPSQVNQTQLLQCYSCNAQIKERICQYGIQY